MSSDDPIAIIGIAGQMPGAENLEEFWQNLLTDKEIIGEIPSTRWEWQQYYGDPQMDSNKTRVKWGGFISDVYCFDAEFFNIMPGEAKFIDPQHRVFLQTTWELFEDAGYNPSNLIGQNISVFVGVSTQDYRKRLDHPDFVTSAYVSTGMAVSMLANRVSYHFGLCGPSDITDTACSSSLVTIHRAIASIHKEKCKMAIAGGVNLILIPDGMIAFDKAGMLTHDREMRAFDRDAKGYIRGEGVGAVLLKPLSTAVAEGDHIYAVIKGCAINHNGRSYSLTAPDMNAQAKVVTAAYQQASIDLKTIDYIEAHGTATQLGDNMEIRALKKAFAQLGYQEQHKIKIGTIKPNIGHLEAASGIASLLKVILSLKHKMKLGIKNFKQLNPLIKLKDSPFYITAQHEAWDCLPRDSGKFLPRRASIHSFGFSGVNAHIIVEEWDGDFQPAHLKRDGANIIVLSARDKDTLQKKVTRLSEYVALHPKIPLANIAYTLQIGRQDMKERLAIVAATVEELQQKLERWLCNKVDAAVQEVPNTQELTTIYDSDIKEVASLWLAGAKVDWQKFYKPGVISRSAGLPSYPFAKTKYWLPNSPPAKNFKKQLFSSDSQQILGLLKSFTSELTGYSQQQLAEQKTFLEMGLDSLSLTELQNQLSNYFAFRFSHTILHDHNTLEKLAIYIQKNIGLTKEFSPTLSHSRSPLPRAPLKENYPLSLEQLRYWKSHHFISSREHSQSLSIPIYLKVSTIIDDNFFSKALQMLLAHQTVLRTAFCEQSSAVHQKIWESISLPRTVWQIESITELHPIVTEFISTTWDLCEGTLWKIGLVHHGNDTYLLLVMHHIIADLWSIRIFLDELSSLYCAWKKELPSPLAGLSHTYIDYAYQETAALDKNEKEKRLSYWRKQLAFTFGELDLSFAEHKKRQQKNKAQLFSCSLDNALYQELQAFCKNQQQTMFNVHLCALKLLLYGLTEQSTIPIGIAFQNREEMEWQKIIGSFALVSISISEMNEQQTVLEFLQGTYNNTMAIRQNILNLSELTPLIQREEHDPLCPVLQVVFNYMTFPEKFSHLFDADTQILPVARNLIDFDIALTIMEQNQQMFLNVEYAQNLFSPAGIAKITKQWQDILTWMIRFPDDPIAMLFNRNNLMRRKHICIASTFTAQSITNSLLFWSHHLQQPIKISFADFSQVFQELLNPLGILRRNKNGVNVLLIRLTDWLKEFKRPTPEIKEDLEKITFEFTELVTAAIRDSIPYIVLICPEPPDLPNRVLQIVLEYKQHIIQKLKSANVAVIDTTKSIYHQKDNYCDTVLDELAQIPYSPKYFTALGTIIYRECFRYWIPSYKVIVVDGDQTLWRGIVGEDGVDGIVLDPARFKLQKRLLELQQSGILLCLASKNLQQDVLDILERRKDFLLQKEHFAHLKANWKPKSANIKEMAEELNLGLDSFLFIDDNPLEIAEVMAQCPSILSLQLPKDDKQIELFVDHLWFFDATISSEEDKQRTQYYRENLMRKHAKQKSLNYSEFIQNLDLKVTFNTITATQIARASQLTQRTNQFNSTTIRRNESEILELIKQQEYLIETVTVKDRFGDYGFVGLLIVRFTPQQAIIDSFILSCRALGRGVEHAMLAKVADLALKKNVATVEIAFLPTSKNKPISNFLQTIPNRISAEEKYYLFHTSELKEIKFSPEDVSEVNDNPKNVAEIKDDGAYHKLQWPALWLKFSDTSALQKAIEQHFQKHYHTEDYVAPVTKTEQILATIWQDVLHMDNISTNTSSFDIASSLQLVQILAKIREIFAIPLPLQIFLQNSSICAIAKQIEIYYQKQEFEIINDFDSLLQDAKDVEVLTQQISILNNTDSQKDSFTNTNKVLVTGSSGFLGAYLTSDLLHKTDFVIYCLIREKNLAAAWKKLIANLNSYNLWHDKYKQRIKIVLGDLSKNNLGLSRSIYEQLSKEVCIVYHCGAHVNFSLPYHVLKPANVDGTRQCLKFAATNRLKHVHYVSTASVFDTLEFKQNSYVTESYLDESSVQVYGGYAQSKWVAEMLVHQANSLGIPTTIYRPNGIGPSMDPNYTKFNLSDAFSLFLLASLTIEKFFDSQLHIDFVPVDYIASAIVSLSTTKGSIGKVYAMTNHSPTTLLKIVDHLKNLGKSVVQIPYSDWVCEIERYSTQVNHRKLLALLPLMKEPISPTGESWFELVLRRPLFGCENVIHDLSKTEILCPKIDIDNVMKLLLLTFLTNNFLESTGEIKSLGYGSNEQHLKKQDQQTVLILTWSLGGGHNAVSEAIKQTLENYDNIEVCIIDLGTQFSYVKNLEKFWNHISRYNVSQLDAYTEVTQVCNQHQTLQFREIYQTTTHRLVDQYHPDAVISVCPLGCQLLRYIKEKQPHIHTITYVSDWFGGAYKEWGDSGADWIYSPSKQCSLFLREMCFHENENLSPKIVEGSLIVKAGFSEYVTNTSKEQLRYKLGIKPDEQVLLFNSYGNAKSLDLLKKVDIKKDVLKIIVLCYNNPEVMEEISSLNSLLKEKIEGKLWIDNLHEWLFVSDVVFTKPGPAICAESIMTDTVIFMNALEGIMPQERQVYQNMLEEELCFNIATVLDFEKSICQWQEESIKFKKIKDNVYNKNIVDGGPDFCQKVITSLLCKKGSASCENNLFPDHYV